jgi:site-specific recombinase XerD
MNARTKPSTAELVEAFLAEEKAKVTPQGYQSVQKLAWKVVAWLEAAELEPEAVGIQEALAWQYVLSTQKKNDGRLYQAGTINNHLKAARRVFDYLVKTGIVHTNPFRDLRRVKVGQHLSENALTVPQMASLLEALGRFDECSPWWNRLKVYRVHVVAELMYSAGLHASEAAALEVADVDLVARTVWVRTGRNGQGRTGFLTSYAAEVLAQYLQIRPALFHNYQRTHGHALFGTSYLRLTQVINQVLAETCARLKIPMITSYGLRTSLGVHMVEAGCDLRHVQILLGLRSLGSTQAYLKRCKESLRQVVDAAHPRSTWEARA